jgi:hypothetical protein
MTVESKSSELVPKKGSGIGVAKAVFDILNAVVTDKESMGLEAKWYRFYEMGKNKQWRKQSADLTLVSANLLSVHRRKTVNSLTDNNPTFNVKRVVSTADTEDRFKMVLHSVEHWWGETEQQDVLEQSVHNGETYGVCIEKSVFDLDKEYGIGEVDTVIVDPYHFGIFPVKCLDIQKAEANVHYYPMSVRDIKRKWGNAAADVVADTDITSTSDDRRMVSGVKDTLPTTTSSSIGGMIKKLLTTLGGNTGSSGEEAIVVECWVKDYTPNETGIGPLYPGFIRCITAVNGSIVLDDRANPNINPNIDQELASNTYLYDKFPFSKANSNKDPVNFWGESDFEQLMGLQMEFNKSLSQFSSLKDKVAGVKFINPKTSGVNNSAITNGSSIINPDTINHGMSYMEPPPIPKELMESVNAYKELFFIVAGTFDLESANTPGGQVIAYKAIAALIENASTMMKGKIRNYGKLIRDRGRMAVSQMQNWYTEPRFISFIDNGDEVEGQAFGPDMIVPLKLSVVSGSTMPKSEVQRRDEAIGLYEKGAIDAEELLKALNWDKPTEVVNRMAKGPVNQFIEKLLKAGMPQEMSQYFSDVAAVDDKQLDRALDRAEMPFFNQIFAFQGMQPDVKQEISIAKARAEVAESDARKEEALANVDATIASARKDMESIRQTDERIKIDKAKVVHEARTKERDQMLKEKEIKSAASQPSV